MGVQSFGNPGASFRGRFGRTGKRASNPFVPTLSATGGTKTTSGLYTVHTFNASDSFNVQNAPASFELEYLVVAGGGGGGNTRGGGGGGGGLRSNHPSMPAPLKSSPYPVIGSATFTVVVGNGGSGRPYPDPGSGTPGGVSEFYPVLVSYPSPTYIRSDGGGVGAGRPTAQTAGNGGSGGGGSQDQANWPGGLGNSPPTSPPRGNPGGTSVGPEPGWRGSGGGGSGGAGAAGGTPASHPGNGGPALPISISGSSITYAGGGGAGAAGPAPGAGSADPSAGPGTYGSSGTAIGSNAPSNRGGGGGGGGDDSSGGNGGSGVVIIRYLTTPS